MSNGGSVTAVVLARGGSMGFPGRDLAVIGGRPLVARTVRTLQQAGLGQIVVGTEDPQVAEVARAAGAEVARVRRTSMADVALLEVLDTLPGGGPDLALLAGCGAPFTTADDVAGVLDLVRTGGFDCGLAVTASRDYLWHVQGTGVNHDPGLPRRSQNRGLQFRETGSVYAVRTAGLRENGRMFFGHIGLHEVPGSRAMTVDSLEDLEAARQLAPLWDEVELVEVDAVVTDFEGAHVDDRMVVWPDGTEAMVVRRGDGDGVRSMLAGGVRVLVLSGDPSPVAGARAAKLGAEVAQHVVDKAEAVAGWLQYARIHPARAAYLGTEPRDLPAMAMVGWPVAVADAHPQVLAAARIVLTRPAGRGAVRELADRVLEAKGTPR